MSGPAWAPAQLREPRVTSPSPRGRGGHFTFYWKAGNNPALPASAHPPATSTLLLVQFASPFFPVQDIQRQKRHHLRDSFSPSNFSFKA